MKFVLVLVGAHIDEFHLDTPNIPPATVINITLSAYLGRWFQIYDSYLANSTFEKNAYCVTADYTFVSDKKFNVTNYETLNSPSGTSQNAIGCAVLPNEAEIGKWRVFFEKGSPLGGAYWIIELGPINPVTGLYEYSVVSSPFRANLFVLARDVATFRQVYAPALLLKLTSEGFNKSFNTPIPTYQETDCIYASVP